MENLKSYNDFINEGIKENIIGAALFLSTLTASGKETKQQIIKRSVYNKERAESMIKDGWKLASIEVDTIFNKVAEEKPKSEIKVINLDIDSDKTFTPGGFEIDENLKNDIDLILDTISEMGLIPLKIEIQSSTDKQPLKQSFKDEISRLGYEPNNRGLSELRSDVVKNYLISNGINSDLILKDVLYEQGDENSPEDRYVKLDFYAMDIKQDVYYPEEKDDDFEIKTKYNLELINDYTIKKRLKRTYNKTDMSNIGKSEDYKDLNVKNLKCPKNQ